MGEGKRFRTKKPIVVPVVLGSWRDLVQAGTELEHTPNDLFESDAKFDTWGWCLHCEQCWQYGDMLFVGGYWVCPGYPDCSGTLMHMWRWNYFREQYPLCGGFAYPEVPVRGHRYAMYPD